MKRKAGCEASREENCKSVHRPKLSNVKLAVSNNFVQDVYGLRVTK